ncbi:MAG: hypothetical protein GXO80_04325 [Chlorobi bacterium]|nr:hypothetical protein [Chlorobiota bacterium]
MREIKIGKKVRLAIDSKSTYEIIEINPLETKGITIRRFGDAMMVLVSPFEIIEITDIKNGD